MEEEYTNKYSEFASNISFFEFLQEEFKQPHFKISNYSKEIKNLSGKNNWKVEELSKLLRGNPKSFEVFEEIFQLSRFTNTQLIHFLFDVEILNNGIGSSKINYLKKNLEFDKLFAEIFIKKGKEVSFEGAQLDNVEEIIQFIGSNTDQKSTEDLFLLLKKTVVEYTEKAKKKEEIIHKRISNKAFGDISKRIAEYLINNLNLKEVLQGIKLKEYLENKRIPCDTKSLHGKYGTIRISKILEKDDGEWTPCGTTEIEVMLKITPVTKRTRDYKNIIKDTLWE